MNDLTKLIFEKLEVEPNEEFEIAVNGKKSDSLFSISDSLVVWYKEDNEWHETSWTINYFITSAVKIIKIVKPLVTEEEKTFLKFWEFEKIRISNNPTYKLLVIVCANGIATCISLTYLNLTFSGLEEEKYYTPKELGL